MYYIDKETGYIKRSSDNKIVSPIEDVNDPDYIEYLNWVKAGNDPIISADITSERLKTELAQWENIKQLREAKKFAGVLVNNTYWFHSDQDSRIQQLGLIVLGQNLPSGVMWKILSDKPDLANPSFVELTPELVQAVVISTLQSDMAFHAAAENIRAQMVASEDPAAFDITQGWPVSFLDLLGQ